MTLKGRHVLVTRPAGQASHLAEALVAAGATPVLFPVLAIAPLPDVRPLVEQIIALDQYHFAVFVSPNAVSMGLKEVLARRTWPPGLRVATVGHSSEAALQAHDLGGQEKQVLCPQGRFDSEALLELPELQAVTGRRIIIFRGDGGRELLAETLRERGASVEYVTCYRRYCPDADPAPLLEPIARGAVDGLLLTSSEGVRNLESMLGADGLAALRGVTVFATHPRIVAQAHAAGFAKVVETPAGDDGLMQALESHFA
jgi:uroporphyrinogen-III synthase